MVLNRNERRRLKRRTQEHTNGKRISMLECPRCPGYADAARKVVGSYPLWYPSKPEKIFVQCPGCDLLWDTRG